MDVYSQEIGPTPSLDLCGALAKRKRYANGHAFDSRHDAAAYLFDTTKCMPV